MSYNTSINSHIHQPQNSSALRSELNKNESILGKRQRKPAVDDPEKNSDQEPQQENQSSSNEKSKDSGTKVQKGGEVEKKSGYKPSGIQQPPVHPSHMFHGQMLPGFMQHQ